MTDALLDTWPTVPAPFDPIAFARWWSRHFEAGIACMEAPPEGIEPSWIARLIGALDRLSAVHLLGPSVLTDGALRFLTEELPAIERYADAVDDALFREIAQALRRHGFGRRLPSVTRLAAV